MAARTPTEINERFRDAYNARDLGGLIDLYEPDAIVVPGPDAPPKRGLAEIEDALRAFLTIGGILSFDRRHSVVNGDCALLSIDWMLAGGSVDGKPVTLSARSCELVRRQPDGNWKYVIDHLFAEVDSRLDAALKEPHDKGASASSRPHFIIRLVPQRGIDLLKNPTPEERAIMCAHREYMELLSARRQLVLTGLSERAGDVDGMVIVESDSEPEARQLMASHRFVLSGIMRAELRPFRTVKSRA